MCGISFQKILYQKNFKAYCIFALLMYFNSEDQYRRSFCTFWNESLNLDNVQISSWSKVLCLITGRGTKQIFKNNA